MPDMFRIDGDEAWIQALSKDLQPAIHATVFGAATELQKVMAPYPAAPVAGNPWYERGYGRKYRRKDGSVSGKKTSETLGRSWTIASAGRVKVLLMNRASYSAFVHDSEEQASIHTSTGWKTEQDGSEALDRSGVVQEIAYDAITKVLKVG